MLLVIVMSHNHCHTLLQMNLHVGFRSTAFFVGLVVSPGRNATCQRSRKPRRGTSAPFWQACGLPPLHTVHVIEGSEVIADRADITVLVWPERTPPRDVAVETERNPPALSTLHTERLRLNTETEKNVYCVLFVNMTVEKHTMTCVLFSLVSFLTWLSCFIRLCLQLNRLFLYKFNVLKPLSSFQAVDISLWFKYSW